MKKYWLISLLFIIGLTIVLYPHVAKWIHQVQQMKTVHAFQKKVQEKDKEDRDKLIDQATLCNNLIGGDWSFSDPFVENEEKLNEFKMCMDMNEGEMFAAIEIPKLDILIPIYLGSSEDVLREGIGYVEGSSLPIGGRGTHTVLAGHRGMGTKEMFRNIEQLHEGDHFLIYTMTETLVYEVYDQAVIYPDELEWLAIDDSRDLATLLTCHPYRHNYQRLLIQAERISHE